MTDVKEHTYSVRAIFDTFQGEGARAGRRSIFVRFAGCNLWDGLHEHRERGRGACAAWCDTDFVRGKPFTAQAIVSLLGQAWTGPGERWAVLTGGEPLLQVDDELLAALHAADWRVAVETNGTMDAPVGIDWLTVSPKLPAGGRPETDWLYFVLEHADELKVVLPGHPEPEKDWLDEDLERMAKRLRPAHLYVQPCDPTAMRPKVLTRNGTLRDARQERLGAAFNRCAHFVRDHPDWTIGIQMQKVAGIP